MAREALESASEALGAASDETTDESVSERLREQAGQLGRLAERPDGPDHGRLARHEYALRELLVDADEATAPGIETAMKHIAAYRETIEGV